MAQCIELLIWQRKYSFKDGIRADILLRFSTDSAYIEFEHFESTLMG